MESPSSNMTNEYTPNVKGRLKENIFFWEEIGASSWVLSILRDGYALPFISEPEPKIFQNTVSALTNKEFVTNEILDLLNSGRVREVSQNEIEVLNPLTVADNGQKLRLILDCRHINSFLRFPDSNVMISVLSLICSRLEIISSSSTLRVVIITLIS